jgi:hypothetical protein
VIVRFYLDEDAMSQGLVEGLRSHGLDVLTTQEARMRGRSDEEHLELAASQGRVLYSFNVAHFFSLHSSWLSAGRSHAGLVLAQQRQFSIGEQMRRLLKLIANRSAEEMTDRLEFLSSWS